jgi:hypothetical protein
MQYAITPKAAIATGIDNRRKYLNRDLGVADFSSMFEFSYCEAIGESCLAVGLRSHL